MPPRLCVNAAMHGSRIRDSDIIALPDGDGKCLGRAVSTMYLIPASRHHYMSSGASVGSTLG